MYRHVIKALLVAGIVGLYPFGTAHAFKSFIGCPGENHTLGWGINVNEEICVKMYEYVTGEPAVVRFWNNRLFDNKGLGEHRGSACFQLGGAKYRLRAGHLQTTTIFFVFAGRSSVFYSHTFEWDNVVGQAPSGRYDPCKPRCDQVPAPERELPKNCEWTCYTNGRTGDWQIMCNAMIFDPVTGEPRPAP